MLQVFDIDGTITKENIDLWKIISEELYPNKNEFEQLLIEFKQRDNNYNNSLETMSKVVNKINYKNLYQVSFETIDYLFKNNLIRLDAINKLKESQFILLNSTNYIDVVKVFKSYLIDELSINSTIWVQGTVSDWNKRKVEFFNMGERKVKYLLKNEYIAYADDCVNNDKELLKNALKGYLITTKKNEKIKYEGERLCWK